MSVTIKNKPSIEEKEKHQICEYFGFIDSEERFFLITDDDTIVLMNEDFQSYNCEGEFNLIENFLKCEFDTVLIRAYKRDDFDVTIEIK